MGRTVRLSQIVERDRESSIAVLLEIGDLNLLAQVRRTMDRAKVIELAESILHEGQLAQGIAAALSPSEAQVYVEEINLIHGSNHTLDQLTSTTIDGKKYYIALVAGHRRYNAVKYLIDNAAEHTAHFRGRYRVLLHFRMTADRALSIQFQENRHSAVPIHEEVDAAYRFWLFLRRKDEKLTKAGFGRRIGRSAAWVTNMLRFCDLPESLQSMVVPGENGDAERRQVVSYGILTEAAYLRERLERLGHSMDEQSLLRLVLDAIIRNTKVSDFKKIVASRIEHKTTRQESFLGDEPKPPRKPIRQTVAPQMIKGLLAFIHYFRLLEDIRAQGFFEGESQLAPETDRRVRKDYSPLSPLGLSVKLLRAFRQIRPHLVELARREGGRHRRELTEGEEAVDAVLGLFEELLATEDSAED